MHQYDGHGLDGESLEELRRLTESAGAYVAGTITGRRRHPHPATFLGSGKAQEVADLVAQIGASLVVVDHALTPIQERNLERLWDCPVVDRTRLILDIFAQRATSREGKLQVELAQLEHLATRLVRGWTHLERQKGGIGLRGPGETQLETDRRLIGRRIKTLKRQLHRIGAQRALRRNSRRKVPIATVSLVGYTNAGKSSLFNRLTRSEVYAANKLFATLDPTMRRWIVEGYGPVVLSDTVGFIRELPHSLVSAFHATLEEVAMASLLIHVVDAANPEHRELVEHVHGVLEEIGAAEVPRLTVFNKIDKSGHAPRSERNAEGQIDKVWLSAHSGDGVADLDRAVAGILGAQRVVQKLRLPPEAARLRAKIYEHCEVLTEEVAENGDTSLEVLIDRKTQGWLEAQSDFRAEYRPVESRCAERS